MDNASTIDGMRLTDCHLVSGLLSNGYAVTIFNRENHDNPFEDDPCVQHVWSDRTDDEALRTVKLTVAPDAVFDCVAHKPAEVAPAVDVFANVGVYAYTSSGAAYESEVTPRREGETLLCDCIDEQAADDSGVSYDPRKTEDDRIVFETASWDIDVMSVRPCVVYDLDDYTERLDYWTDCALDYDHVVVPGDGMNVWHRAYVKDVVGATRIVAEEGEAGEAYNVGDRQLVMLEEVVGAITDAVGTDIEAIHAGERELATVSLLVDSLILYRDYPHVLSTNKLARLGWESVPVEEAMRRSVADHRDSNHDGAEHDSGCDAEERVLSILDIL